MIFLMKEKVKNIKKGDWIKGVNFDQSKWKENRFPTLEEMDSISKDNPVIIKRCCLHAVVANSKALEIAGIGKNYQAGRFFLLPLFRTPRLRAGSFLIFDEEASPKNSSALRLKTRYVICPIAD